MPVRFLKGYGRYGVNEVAGFRPDHEAFLVEQGFAEALQTAPASTEPGSSSEEGNDMAKTVSKDGQDEKGKPAAGGPTPPKTRQTTVGPQTRKT